MLDLISRQAAIKALENCELGEEVFMIKSLPFAQPEIIHCRECKHGKFDIFDRGMWCELHPSLDVTEEDFCSRAERKGEQNG